MRPRWVVTLLVVGAIIALTPLAQASPPDQTWLPGLYDDGDHDDVVLHITSAVGAVQALAPSHGERFAVQATAVVEVAESLIPAAPGSSHPSRAPPAS